MYRSRRFGPMTRFAIFLALLLALAHSAPAAEPVGDKLRQLGAKLREEHGAIVELNADAKNFTEAEYRLIGQCTRLKKLSLNGKTLTDTTLPLLAGLTELEEFSCNGSTLSDDGYRHFAAFKKLRSLALWHPSGGVKDFTGAGLAHLKSLPNLQRLTFAGSAAGDAMLAAVGQLTQIRDFSTWHTAQTQAGNAHLLKLPHLMSLRIGQRLLWGKPTAPSLDDSTLATLAQIKSLESLEVSEARLTGPALQQFKSLPNLKHLSIRASDVSDADIQALRSALPAVKIDFKPITAEERDMLVKKLKL